MLSSVNNEWSLISSTFPFPSILKRKLNFIGILKESTEQIRSQRNNNRTKYEILQARWEKLDQPIELIKTCAPWICVNRRVTHQRFINRNISVSSHEVSIMCSLHCFEISVVSTFYLQNYYKQLMYDIRRKIECVFLGMICFISPELARWLPYSLSLYFS